MKYGVSRKGRRQAKLVIFISGLILASGCTFGPAAVEEMDWQEEILWMDECGLADMACCHDGDSACDEGLACCVSPIDPGTDMCRSDCACGTEGNFCCAEGDLCSSGLACADNVCRVCGGRDQPCCPGQACGTDLVCYREECVPCGLDQNPCCESGLKCLDSEARDATRTECAGGSCRFCGWGGGPVCAEAPACSPENLPNNGACLNCGGANEPCCLDPEATSTPYCLTAGYDCRAGFCISD